MADKLNTGDIVWLDMGFGTYDIRRMGVILGRGRSAVTFNPTARVQWLDSGAIEEYISAYLVLYCTDF